MVTIFSKKLHQRCSTGSYIRHWGRYCFLVVENEMMDPFHKNTRSNFNAIPQLPFTCSKSTIETRAKGVTHFQS